jgi:hypothetical protein
MDLKHIERRTTDATAWLKPDAEDGKFVGSYLRKEVSGPLLAATVTLEEASRLENGDLEPIKSSLHTDPADPNSYSVVGSRNFSLSQGEAPALNGIRTFKEVAPDPVSTGESA